MKTIMMGHTALRRLCGTENLPAMWKALSAQGLPPEVLRSLM